MTVMQPRPPIPHQDLAEDRTLAMLAALAAELAIVRERLDTVERLAADAGVFLPDAVEHYAPSAEAAEARTTIRKRLIAKIFRPLRDDAERAAREISATRPEGEAK